MSSPSNQGAGRDPGILRNRPPGPPWRVRLYDVVFDSEDPAARAFDVGLILAILLSVLVVMLDSVESIASRHHDLLAVVEWFFTILFTVEYVARLVAVRSKRRYALSFFGIIDLASIAPTYLSLILPGTQYFAAIRVLRVLRVFRVLKLVQYIGEANVLSRAVVASRHRITVFLIAVVALVVVLGSLMYLVEGADAGFTSIPTAVYWAVVTLTTVGFGDITPITPAGKLLASVIMLMGYGLIAVPTGIFSAELAQASREQASRPSAPVREAPGASMCKACGAGGHEPDASYCRRCGAPLGPS